MANARSVFLAVIKGDASQAVSEFDKLGKSVEKSTGKSATALDKFKSLSKSAFAEATAALKSPAGMATAIAATGAAAFKAANQFSGLAKSAIDLGKATGLSTEEASRWIAVGDDFGVSADTLASGIGRIAKTLDSGKWEKYGIATEDAAGRNRAANDVLLDALDVLGQTTDATERARIGTDLFGKGFTSLSPIIGKTRSEYEAMLQSVSQGQVITDGEAAAGEKWRLALDNLNDSFGDVVLSLGELAVAGAPALDALAKVFSLAAQAVELTHATDQSATAVTTLGTRLEETSGSAVQSAIAVTDMATSAARSKNALQQFGLFVRQGFDNGAVSVTTMKDAINQLGDESPKSAARAYLALLGVARAAEDGDEAAIILAEGWKINAKNLEIWRNQLDMTDGELYAVADSMDLLTQAGIMTNDMLVGIGGPSITGGIGMVVQNLNEMERAANIAAWEVSTIETAFADLIGLIDERQALRNVGDQFDRVTKAAEDYYTAVAEGSDDAEALQRDYLRALDDLRLKGLDYMTMLGEIPPYKATEFLALIDQGKYDEAKALLDGLAVGRTVGFRPKVTMDGAGGIAGGQFVLRPEDFLATGGPAMAGSPYVVGEKGPELFVPGMSGTVIPNHALGSGTVNMTVIVNQPIASGEQLANELAAYTRRNGSRWLVPA